MSQALINKLETFTSLDAADREKLASLSSGARSYRNGEVLAQEGQKPDCVFLLTEGWACRYKMLADGQRQILAYMLPGDTCDIFNHAVDHMDHSIAAIGACKAVPIPQAELMDAIARHPAIAYALHRSTIVDGSMSRECMLNIGQRDGFSRIAHLFSELLARMDAIGLVTNGKFAMPCTQTDLADTIGLTPVYVNRTLQRMRGEGLILLRKRCLTVLEPERLIAASAFTSAYLHLNERADPVPMSIAA